MLTPRRQSVAQIEQHGSMNSRTGRYPFSIAGCDCCYAIASMSADADKAIAKTDTTWAKRNATSLRQLSAHLRPARPTGRWLGFNIRHDLVHTMRCSVNR